MPKVKISEYSATANSNTDVASINIDEGCAPSGINNAIRAVMGHLKDFQSGTNGDPFNGPVNGTVGATTPSTGAFTTLSATGNVTLGDASTDTLNVGNGGLIKDASGNVGVGFTPSANAGVSTLSIANYNKTFSALTFGSNANSAGYVGYNMGNTSTSNTWKYISADTGSALYFAGNEFRFMQFASGSAGATTTGTQAMTLDASGNWGIGTTSPSFRLHAVSSAAVVSRIGSSGGSGAFINFIDSGASPSVAPSVGAIGNSLVFMGDGSSSERARIDSSGNLLVGTTSQFSGSGIFPKVSIVGTDGLGISGLGSDKVGLATKASSTANYYAGFFLNSSSTGVGNITVSTTATAYNTASDYRLKKNVQPMAGALAKVASLKPCTYNWKSTGEASEGFIAHELAEVVPQCVTGEKDAVDAEGKPIYQGIDTSFLVATLTAAIQEQQSIIQSLTARITALEGA